MRALHKLLPLSQPIICWVSLEVPPHYVWPIICENPFILISNPCDVSLIFRPHIFIQSLVGSLYKAPSPLQFLIGIPPPWFLPLYKQGAQHWNFSLCALCGKSFRKKNWNCVNFACFSVSLKTCGWYFLCPCQMRLNYLTFFIRFSSFFLEHFVAIFGYFHMDLFEIWRLLK